jgi:hypothetical protein
MRVAVARAQRAGGVAALVGEHRPVVPGELRILLLELAALFQVALPVPNRVPVAMVGLLP